MDSTQILLGQKLTDNESTDVRRASQSTGSSKNRSTSKLEVARRRVSRKRFDAKLEVFNIDHTAEKKKHDILNLYKKVNGYDLDEYELTYFPERGFNYVYHSDTSDEDTKYVNSKNRRFSSWRKKVRTAHIKKLWNTCRIKAFTAAVTISIFNSINTKVAYFGR